MKPQAGAIEWIPVRWLVLRLVAQLFVFALILAVSIFYGPVVNELVDGKLMTLGSERAEGCRLSQSEPAMSRLPLGLIIPEPCPAWQIFKAVKTNLNPCLPA